MVKVSQLNNAIADALKNYTHEVEDDLEKVKKQVATNAIQKLKQRSPKKKGSYSRGWRMKKTAKGQVIYNATDAGKTHLLEFGHAKRGGGRVQGVKHIEPVEQEAIQEFIEETERVVKR
ncbi:HK97 gp10 family phage protein [Listeria sp. ILCC797]|uniref:HK97 gp10 family phage protein n=1 Tax=Listeria sp. ILCC797 TaxID=1918333 RepID=UPI000B595F66|nr:HK97 gp10 family phage protein [Listeria sp. ILCC797]